MVHFTIHNNRNIKNFEIDEEKDPEQLWPELSCREWQHVDSFNS